MLLLEYKLSGEAHSQNSESTQHVYIGQAAIALCVKTIGCSVCWFSHVAHHLLIEDSSHKFFRYLRANYGAPSNPMFAAAPH